MERWNRPIMIAGPCAAENATQIAQSIQEVKKRDIPIMRASLVKPRTKHGWDGVGLEEGIPLLKQVSEQGITPATEVLDIDEANKIVEGVLGQDDGSLMLWVGSRNQNHRFQRELGRLAAHDSRLIVGAKNQPWRSEDHLRGIISHMSDGGGVHREQLLMIMRGFSEINSRGYRNVPDYEMAQAIKEEEGVTLIFDPSHIGGSKEKVIEVAHEGMAFPTSGVIFDGLMVEVHPDRKNAKTDQKQQLTWTEFDNHIIPLITKGDTTYAAD